MEFDTATVSNAIEKFGVRDPTEGYASRDVECYYPELGTLVGFAVTCTVDSTTRGPRPPSRLAELIDLVEAGRKPAVVVCQYVGADRSRGCFAGDVLAALLHRLGAVGLVTDAPTRDLQTIQLRAPGFHMFGYGAVASHGNGSIVDVNLPVVIQGLRVEPGDLIHGDVNGVISIPMAIAGRVAASAQQVRTDEQGVFDLLADPNASIEAVKARFRSQPGIKAT